MMLEPGSIGGLAAVALAGFVAGGMNAIAGGGTFLAFPVLDVGLGLGPRVANIACTLGLWPGSAASVVVARRDIATLPRWMIWLFAPLCGVGGAIGAVLLLITPPHCPDAGDPVVFAVCHVGVCVWQAGGGDAAGETGSEDGRGLRG